MNGNVISLEEWKRIKRRVNSMTLPELAMVVHQLIEEFVELKEERKSDD